MDKFIVIIVESFLISGMTAFLVLEYFKTFFVKKNIKAFGCRVWAIYYIWQILSVYIMADAPIWCKMIFGVLFSVITSCFFNGDFLAKLVFSVLFTVIWVLGELLIGSLFLLFKISISSNMLAGSIISKILLVIFIKVLQLFFHNSVICGLSWKINLVLMFLPVGSMVIVHYIFIAGYMINKLDIICNAVICILIIIAINIVVFILYIRLSENIELKHKNLVYEKEFELLDVHIKEKENAVIEFRRKKHNLKHQMMKLLDLLQYKQYEELEKNIMELADLKSFDDLKIADTDNSIIDAFVNYKYETAKRNGIDFMAGLNIPSQLPFKDGDLCVILGNVLDNALEANLRSKIDNPYIKLDIRYDGSNLIIIVENSFDGYVVQNRKGEYVTRKGDIENHGLGISLIKSVLKNYHGYYDVKIDGKIYCLNILLHNE